MNWSIKPTVLPVLVLLSVAGAQTIGASVPRTHVGALVSRASDVRLVESDTGTSGSIGSVDMEEIYNASGAAQELDQAGRQHEAEGAQKINRIMAAPYLEIAELEEYGTLIGKLKLTPEEEKRAAALKSMNDQRGNELRSLEAKANGDLKPEEKARIGRLTDLRVTLQNQVRPGLVADFHTQHEGYIADFRHRQIVQLRQEVAKVAKEKHIDHVFDAGTLVFSVNDLTSAVIQRLGKRGSKRPGANGG